MEGGATFPAGDSRPEAAYSIPALSGRVVCLQFRRARSIALSFCTLRLMPPSSTPDPAAPPF